MPAGVSDAGWYQGTLSDTGEVAGDAMDAGEKGEGMAGSVFEL